MSGATCIYFIIELKEAKIGKILEFFEEKTKLNVLKF